MVYKRVPKFLNTHKKNFFLQNTNNFHIFEPKVVALMSHVIYFECLKILTHKNLCNSYI